MAGSYNHILSGWSLIENMGDAAEAVDELMWLIESQIGTPRAKQLLDDYYYPMLRGEKEPDNAMSKVSCLMAREIATDEPDEDDVSGSYITQLEVAEDQLRMQRNTNESFAAYITRLENRLEKQSEQLTKQRITLQKIQDLAATHTHVGN